MGQGSKSSLVAMVACTLFAGPAAAGPQLVHGNDWTRLEIAPNYSRELGWSLKGALGTHVTDDLAIAAIVEYGADKREYLANAGLRLSEDVRFTGSVGLLEEHSDFAADAGELIARQMEYGASLKLDQELGFFHGLEFNGYLADASADSDSIETGKLYGVQLLTDLELTGSTRLTIGGGYEWLRWDAGEETDRFAFRADGLQQLTDQLSATASVKLGASEDVYGGGLHLDLGEASDTNRLSLTYSYIEGRNGIAGDRRVELGWMIGFGESAGASAKDAAPNAQGHAAAAAGNLLADTMKRPDFLPERVLARAVAANDVCPVFTIDYTAVIGAPPPYISSQLIFTTPVAEGSSIRWFIYASADPSTAVEGTLSGTSVIFPFPLSFNTYAVNHKIEARGRGCTSASERVADPF